MTIWFTSDLHFGHKRIVEFTDRKLVTTQVEHDEWLVDLWYSHVRNGDLTYILGDLSFYKDFSKTVEFISRLNGYKIIIKGNHDRREDLNKLVNCDNGGVVGWYDYKEIKIEDKSVVLFHFPVASWHKQHHGSIHLHGHSHGMYQCRGKILDVGIDSSHIVFGQHKIFSSEEILDIMQSKQVHIADIHRKGD